MIPFSPPRIDQKMIDAVTDTLRSGWITTGPKTKLLEKKFAAYCACPSFLCLNSATAGLELMLRWFGVGEGDEVILPAYTYAATANVIVHCGATPVFVDVNEDDFNISVAGLEKAITERTKVIMPVDFAGMPCDYDAIHALITKKTSLFKPTTEEQKQLGRILVLADAAHSIGAVYKGKRAGPLTDVSVFSFHAVKNLTTAEGGGIAFRLPAPFNNEELYQQLCISSLHGQNKDALAKTQKGNWRYDIVEAGYKCNMTDIQAALGLVELERYETDTLVKRRHIFDLYAFAFSNYAWAQVPIFERNQGQTRSSCHVFALRIKGISEAQRDEIIRLIFDQEVSVNVHFIPVPMMSFYKKMGYDIKSCPKAYDNYSREISLPVYYGLNAESIQTVIDAVVMAVQKVIG
jgi:dTDP-4-amino-4,6-dideoxygalactose transaminase